MIMIIMVLFLKKTNNFILQDDVYRNKYDYLLEIDNSIKKIKTENKPQVIYIFNYFTILTILTILIVHTIN